MVALSPAHAGPVHAGRNDAEPIEIVPLTLHIGAEIRGVDLTQPLPPAQLQAVRAAFLQWKVIFSLLALLEP